MLRRVHFYSILCFGVSVLLIILGIRCIESINFRGRHLRFLRIEDADDNNGHMQPFSTNFYVDSPTINKILKEERTKIKQEWRSLNSFLSGPHKLEDMLMELGGQPQRTLIISTWRSGTSFLGEILNAVPGNFYHYEPLSKYGVMQIRGLPHSTRALNEVKKMFKCKFDDMIDYFKFARGNLYQLSLNTRLWFHCNYKRQRDLCFDASFMEKFCKLFPFQSMKVLRLRLRLVQEIITDKELNVKVVLLIRDPRGVMRSRLQLDFCKPSPDCWNPELLCADMISDYIAAAKLLKQHPDRLMVLRYEELTLKPNETAHQILDFLGLSMMPTINKYLLMHTTMNQSSFTTRVSRKLLFNWKKMDFDFVQNIQLACKQAMNLWGYRMAYNASHMASDKFNPLQNYVVHVVGKY